MADSNETSESALSQERQYELLVKFWVYVVQGLFLAIGNFLILATVARHKLLRLQKEYIVMSGLALTDLMNGLATFLAGLLRNLLILDGTGVVLVSRWACLWTSWNQLYIWSDPMSAVMLLVVSVDRLVAVSLPTRYFKFTRTYGWALVGGAYGFMLVCVLTAIALTFPYQQPEFPAICLTVMGLHPGYYQFHTWLRVVSGVGSVLLYGVVMVILNRKKVAVSNNSAAQNQLRIQRRITKTLGISCLFTTAFYVLPMLIELSTLFVDMNAETMALVIPYTFIINNFNPMLNIFIYSLRLKDMRLGLKCLFECRDLTPMMLNKTTTQTKVLRVEVVKPVAPKPVAQAPVG